MNTLEKTVIILIVSTILLSSTYFGLGYAKSKAQKTIDKKIAQAVEGKWSTIDVIKIHRTNGTAYLTVYNKTGVPIPIPPPPPIPCATGSVIINGKCVPPIPPPNPPPTPTGTTTTVCMTGDLSGSAVPSAMKNCNLKIGLGDLGYQSDLSYFKGLNFNKCVIGNHDALEDGSSAIYQEALAYCGDHWKLITSQGKTMILGLNTNGDSNVQINWVKSILSNSSALNGIKTIIIVSHKNGHVFPNAHHPAEAKSLYSQIEQLTPTSVKLIEVSGHNHNLAQSTNGWFIVGGGGRSHYACGSDAIWNYCDNTHFGFLQFIINNKDGSITSAFYDTNNKLLH